MGVLSTGGGRSLVSLAWIEALGACVGGFSVWIEALGAFEGTLLVLEERGRKGFGSDPERICA